MIAIATVSAASSAPAQVFFEVWADMATWPEWNSDTEWVRLDGAFVEGATGRLKPSGGPSVPFVVSRLIPGSLFVDTSRLLGARLVFTHTVTTSAGLTQIEVRITLDGLLAPVWNRILGPGLRDSAEADLTALVSRAETMVPSA